MAAVFPVLIGQGWSVTKTPTWLTRIRRAISGRELLVSDYPEPVWQFEVTFPVLRGRTTGNVNSTIQGGTVAQLLGFYQARRGPWQVFFYDDPTDDFVLGAAVGVGDGVTTTFQLTRYNGDPSFIINGFSEAITAPSVVSAVYLGPVRQPTLAWSVNTGTGLLSFKTAPGAGVQITADFTFYYRCRFTEDSIQVEEFAYRYHTVKKLTFQSVIGDVTPTS